jgi:hypothetical protein
MGLASLERHVLRPEDSRGHPMQSGSLKGHPMVSGSLKGYPMVSGTIKGGPMASGSLKECPIVSEDSELHPIRSADLAPLMRSIDRRLLNRAPGEGIEPWEIVVAKVQARSSSVRTGQGQIVSLIVRGVSHAH